MTVTTTADLSSFYGSFSFRKARNDVANRLSSPGADARAPRKLSVVPSPGRGYLMVLSAAKLEANRRNAPRKALGHEQRRARDRSKMNAASNTVVGPRRLCCRRKTRRNLKIAAQPGRPALGRVVSSSSGPSMTPSFIRGGKTATRRAEAARADVGMADGGERERKATLKEVADLGRRLFKDRLGPVAFYPLVAHYAAIMGTRSASTSYPPRQDDEDPDLPAALVLDLQSTLSRLRLDAR